MSISYSEPSGVIAVTAFTKRVASRRKYCGAGSCFSPFEVAPSGAS